MDERRQSSIESVLLAIGEIKQVGLQNKENIVNLVEQVKIQNGRVTRVERNQEFTKGALWVIGVVFTFIIAPTFVALAVYWLTHQWGVLNGNL